MGIGDEILVTGQVRVMQERDPRKVRIVYEKPRWHSVWDHNPRIAQRGEQGDFQELRPREGYRRPYIRAKNERQWTWQRWGREWGGRAPRGELYFTDEERAFCEQHAGLIIIEPTIKPGASPNKQWNGWRELVHLLPDAVHMGQNQHVNVGARFLHTETIRLAAAVIARARLVITHEGALHHIAAAVGTPAIVIYGGYISPEVTGYEGQVAFFTGEGLGCGMRVPCNHCAKCMSRIEPAMVAEEARKLL